MIELSRVDKHFGEKKVLTQFSHVFETGKITCVMGPSGCGKTTLLRVAAGLLAPDSGSVIREPKNARASFLFQEDRLLPWCDALSNLTALGIGKEAATAALSGVGLREELATKPGTMSGGMQRRLAIARAIAFGGDVFFLDEPLRGLDAETAAPVLAALKAALLGKTALVVTHDEGEASTLGDRVLIL